MHDCIHLSTQNVRMRKMFVNIIVRPEISMIFKICIGILIFSEKSVVVSQIDIYRSKSYYTTVFTSQCHKISNTLSILYFFPTNIIIFSPCSKKIYPLSTNLKQISALRTFPWVCTKNPKLGVFCYLPKYSILVSIISQLVKNLL